MPEHSIFKAVVEEAKSVLVLVEDNLNRVWEEWSPCCIHLSSSGLACKHEKNVEPDKVCIFENCPYIKNKL